MRLDAVKGHLDLLLLSIIARQPAHGYAVIAEMREQTDGVLELTEGAVYPALHRLESQGLLDSEWCSVAGRRRRLYRLTASGRHALGRENAEWITLSSAISTVLRSTTRAVPAL